jgi:hypothetical protein
MKKLITLLESLTNKKVILEEKNIGVIYHYCNIQSLLLILKDYTIKDFVFNRGYVSFTRNGSGIKGRGSNYARLVIDGNKLSNKYKVVPDSIARQDGKISANYKDNITKQAEERIYSKNVNIKDSLICVDIFKDYAVFDLTKDEQLEIEKKTTLNLVSRFTPYKLLESLSKKKIVLEDSVFKSRKMDERLILIKKELEKHMIIDESKKTITVNKDIEYPECLALEKFYQGYSVDVNGDVNLGNNNLSKLPNILFNKIKGSYACDCNNLTSLEPYPKKVRWNYYCFFNAKDFSRSEIADHCKVGASIHAFELEHLK